MRWRSRRAGACAAQAAREAAEALEAAAEAGNDEDCVEVWQRAFWGAVWTAWVHHLQQRRVYVLDLTVLRQAVGNLLEAAVDAAFHGVDPPSPPEPSQDGAP